MEICVRRRTPPGRRKWGWPLNKRLRSLIQKLGEAIHETVSESEDIASVVQDIRKQGFDVLLMLEATIGLNEVEQQPGVALTQAKRLTAGSAGASEEAGGEADTAGALRRRMSAFFARCGSRWKAKREVRQTRV
jgi:hypothetical protein